MRVVIAVAIGLILASSAWAEVTITGQVFELPDTVASVGTVVTLYPDSVSGITDSTGTYTIIADEIGEVSLADELPHLDRVGHLAEDAAWLAQRPTVKAVGRRRESHDSHHGRLHN